MLSFGLTRHLIQPVGITLREIAATTSRNRVGSICARRFFVPALRRFPTHDRPYTRSCAQLTSGHLPTSANVPDKLYETIVVEVRGHDNSVLDSYTKFFNAAAGHLDIDVESVQIPEFDRPGRHFHWWFNTVLKSAFVHKKHKVHYEIRTYVRKYTIKRLTGSTASTFLEYCQRQLPEGVAMKVTMTEILPLPDAIKERLEVS